jgi:diguanylate cyclase (GGDEF)-like protein
VEANGALASIVRYVRFASDGTVVATETLQAAPTSEPSADPTAIAQSIDLAAGQPTVVTRAPLLPSLFGLSETAIEAVTVPVGNGDAGVVYAEIDQTRARRALTRAFDATALTALALAVLAVVLVAFAVSRGRGLNGRRAFNPNKLPRDPLTDLPTRHAFKAVLADSIERAAAAERQVGLLVVDLERFRSVNDVWGHSAGDDVLKAAADRLKAFSVGRADVARITGNHFALIAEGEAAHSLRQLAEKVRAALDRPYEVGESSISLCTNIGAALYPVNADTADMLFRAADTALSKAKANGRGTVAFFDTEMAKRMEQRSALERDLRRALMRGEFVVFYQPQVDIASNRLRGYEALVRWERPGEGIMAPPDFLPVAEETGLIRPLGEWVLFRACRDAATWRDGGIVAVNFSAAQFAANDLDKLIARALAETGLPAERLEIEVPESLVLDHAADVMETLRRVKALGVRVAMDDFAAGYSSLASLAHFPFDKIKIGRTFVRQLTEDADVAAVVAAIVGLGRSLSVDVTAEGVETADQVLLLKAAGCSMAQGFLFGAPERDSDASAGSPGHGDGTAAAQPG